MTIRHYHDIDQGSDEWFAVRRGLLTASEMKLVLTPTLKVASNDKTRAHAWEIAAQRISEYVEPSYVSDDMLRGQEDEIEARAIYAKHYQPAQTCGFITREFQPTDDAPGFILGYSPDALVGTDGLIECKSRRQRFQIETIVGGVMPDDFALQVQTGLLVSGRRWCDFVSYSGGLPMITVRVEPDPAMQAAILVAAGTFETRVREIVAAYHSTLNSTTRLIPTERRIEQEMHL